jgi:exopolysaccharide biosynthesis polyprenyl glycosylphosphotransferase
LTIPVQRDAHLESAVPPWFLWAADACALLAAFAFNLYLAPAAQRLFSPGGALRIPALSWLSLPGRQLMGFASLEDALTLLLVTAPVTLVAIAGLGGYLPVERLSRLRVIATAVIGPLIGLSAFTLVAFALRNQTWSRALVLGDTALAIVLLAGYRIALRTYKLRRRAAGRYARATAFVGDVDGLDSVVSRLAASHSLTEYRPAGYFSPSGEMASSDLPRLGTPDRVLATLVHTPIDLVVVVLPDGPAPWLTEVLQACDYLRVAVQVVPGVVAKVVPALEDLRAMLPVGGGPLPGIFLQPRNVDSGALFFKRMFDLVISGVLLLLLSPLFLVIAIAIKLTTPRAEVFYRWRVIGYQGRPFTGYKFTTMVADADQRRDDLAHLNEMTGPVFKIKNDPRITPLGRFLRKFSLNELPQLWSVLIGDMSLVGPRPAGSWEIGNYQDWHKRKLSFRPGMTCLWQVRGRNKINSFDDWVRMDLEYIDNWSLWLDARILMRTAWVVIAGSGS